VEKRKKTHNLERKTKPTKNKQDIKIESNEGRVEITLEHNVGAVLGVTQKSSCQANTKNAFANL
jgi:hypothetical protein